MPRRLFAISSLLFLAVLAVSPAKNALRPYRAIQREYRRLGLARARSLKAAEAYRQRPVAIQQIWLPSLGNRVDRCTSCHLGVSDPAMAEVSQPFRLHPRTAHTADDLDRFGCTSCHGGQGLATAEADAHGSASDAGPPMLPATHLEAGCGRCHADETVPEAPMLSRGRALMARYNCFACHTARGREGFRPDAPPLDSLPVKTGGEWVRRWLRDPKALDPNATMPRFELADQETEALAQYLFSASVPRDLSRRVSQAEQEPKGDAANGKRLFSEGRCISCHTVEGKGNGSAPELSTIATAATRGWLLSFLRDPHAFYPQTRMPQYHFSESESRDVVAYMEEELRDFQAPKGLLDPLPVNQTLAETGRRLFQRYGCFSCHAPTKAGERFGPDLDGIGDKKAASLDFGRRSDLPRNLPAWLGAKLEAPRSFAQGLRMPSFAFGAFDRRAVVTALLSLSAQPVPAAYLRSAAPQPSMLPGGPVGALIAQYRCLSCHRIGDQGGDLSTAPLAAEGSKVKREWLVDYLVTPYTMRPVLEERMPVLRMPRDEAAKLADAIESFYVDPRVPEDPFAGRPSADGDAGEGQRLYVTLGCRACHQLSNAGGYYGPPLTDSARRLKPGWVYTWLKGPQRWRADVRCPDYGLTDTDALRLTAYLETQTAPPAGAASAGGAR
ncbi:MAG TPA: c-type cytochrome [Vicinamibacteria bacterium]|nr:c-type cytochrome [Vicinamibacteria bacterium]